MGSQESKPVDTSDVKNESHKSARNVFEYIAEIISNEVKKNAEKHDKSLQGDYKRAQFYQRLLRAAEYVWTPPSNPCYFDFKFHTNAPNDRSKDRHPCYLRDINRFSNEGEAECNSSRITGNKGGCGACAPYRRIQLCDYNLEHINDSNINSTDDLLGNLLVMAKSEGDSIVKSHENTGNGIYKSGICTSLARSFADIGDIIRGKDLFLGHKEQKKKLQGNLQKIFNKFKTIYEDLKDVEIDDIREYWWALNRNDVWEALTCSAPGDAKYVKYFPSNTTIVSFDQCGHNDMDVPTNLDYVPQFLRWLNEWAEEFCRIKNIKIGNIKKSCTGESNNKHCSGEGYDCKRTDLKKNEIFMDLDCPRCEEECTSYNEWLKKKEGEFNKQKKKYEMQLNGTESHVNIVNGSYYKAFYDELKNTNKHDNFFKLLNKGQICQNIIEDIKISYDEPEKTFSRSEYCKSCPIFDLKCENGRCKSLDDISCPNIPTMSNISTYKIENPIDINMLMNNNKTKELSPDLKIDFNDCDIFKRLRRQEWNCKYKCNINVCELKNFEYGIDDEKHMLIEVLIKRWLKYFLKDYSQIKEKLNHCINKEKKELQCIKACKKNCECVEKWISKKEKEWTDIKARYIKQYESKDEDVSSKLKTFLQQGLFPEYIKNALDQDEKLDKMKESTECIEPNKPKGKSCKNNDVITILLNRLNDKIETCKKEHEGREGKECCDKLPKSADGEDEDDEEQEDEPPAPTTPSTPNPCVNGGEDAGVGKITSVTDVAERMHMGAQKQMLKRSGKGGGESKVAGKDSEKVSLLKGDIKKAKFKNGASPSSLEDVCGITDQHTKDSRRHHRRRRLRLPPHRRLRLPPRRRRFLLPPLLLRLRFRGVYNGPCTGKDNKKIRFNIGENWKTGDKVSTQDHVFLPPRREHFCTSNLEYLINGKYQKILNVENGKINHSFLGDVLLAAKYQAQHTMNDYQIPNDQEGKCRAVRYSFADIGDIIRGRDLYLGYDDKEKEQRKKLEENLKTIFGNIYEELTTTSGRTNGKTLQALYNDDTDKNYFKLREDWWEANRQEIWKAMTCDLKSGSFPCSDKTTPHEDYIPQRLRWMTEWAEWYCKVQKEEYDKLKVCEKCMDNGKCTQGYVHQEATMNCEKQTQFCKNKNGVKEANDAEDVNYTFKDTPNGYDVVCTCHNRKNPEALPKKKEEDACKIAQDIFKGKDENSTVGQCKKKDFGGKSYPDWKCEKNSKLVTGNGECMPPRRQKLCLYFLAHKIETPNLNTQEDLRKAFIKCAAAETFFSWYYFKKINDKLNKLDEKLKEGEIPPQFLRSMFYTFGDYKDICLDTDISLKTVNGDITKAKSNIDRIIPKKSAKNPDEERKIWWDGIKEDVWKGMLCGLSHAVSNNDKATVQKTLTTKTSIYDYDTVTFDGTTKLDDFSKRPQFLRWMTEWGEEFCKKRKERVDKLVEDCKECNITNNASGGVTKTCERNSTGCKECTKACGDYKTWLETWKGHYEKQKKKYKDDKKSYENDLDANNSDHAYEYLKKQLANIPCTNGTINGKCVYKCMDDKSISSTDDMPASLDNEPQEVQGKCNCKSAPPEEVPKADEKQVEPKKDDICGEDGKTVDCGKVSKNGEIKVPIDPKKNGDTHRNNDGERTNCAGIRTNKSEIKWKNNEDREYSHVKDMHKGVYIPPRRQKLCVRGLKDAKDEIQLKTKLLSAAANDAYNLAVKYDDYKDNYTVPPCHALKYSFYDYKYMILGEDPLEPDKDGTGKALKDLFNRKNSKGGGERSSKERQQFWDKYKSCVWEAMKCGYKQGKTIGEQKAQGKGTKNDVNNIPDINGCTNNTPTEFDNVPQFLMWFTEWSEDFCRTRGVKIKELEKGCKDYECNEENMDQQKKKCEEACQKYQTWLKDWKTQYEKQSQKFTKDKEKPEYNGDPDVTSSENVYKYLSKKLKSICQNGSTTEKCDYKCMENASKQPQTSASSDQQDKSPEQKDLPEAFDYPPKEIGDRCTCPKLPEPKYCVDKTAYDIRKESGKKSDNSLKGNVNTYNDNCKNAKREDYANQNGETCKIKETFWSTNNTSIKECDGNTKERFQIQKYWDCNGKTPDGKNTFCIPPRRKDMCLKKLEDINVNDINDSSLLLKRIQEVAKKEGDDIIKKLLPKYPCNEDVICKYMKYSFADLGDIIRGRDIYKNDNIKIEDNLKRAFNNVYNKNKQKRSKYNDNGDNNYTKLREAWWDTNRKAIWNAMTCSAPEDAKIYITKEGGYISPLTFTKNKCGHNDDPPDYDYIPQPFRWLSEWSETYCLAQKDLLETMKNCENCMKKNKNADCEQTQYGACRDCKRKCEEYKKFIEIWKKQFETQNKAYQEIYRNATSNGGKGEEIDENTKNFVKELEKNCKTDQKTSVDSADKYLENGGVCRRFKFVKTNTHIKNYAFHHTPPSYEEHCQCAKNFDPLDECPVDNNECKKYIKYVCPKKKFNNELEAWTHRVIRRNPKNYEDVIVPARTRQLCLQNVTRNLIRIKNEKEFKEQLLISAASEAKLLSEQYHTERDKAFQAIKYSFADIGNIIKGDDIIGNVISVQLHKLINGNKKINTSTLWWEANKEKIWNVMMCHYKRDEKTTDMCPSHDNIDKEDQFLRWFREWSEHFCARRQKLYEEVKNKCISFKCDTINGIIDPADCDEACTEYKNYITKKRQEYRIIMNQYNTNYKKKKEQSKNASEYFQEKCNSKCQCLFEYIDKGKQWEEVYGSFDDNDLKNKCVCKKIKRIINPNKKKNEDESASAQPKQEEDHIQPPPLTPKPDELPPPTPSTDNTSDILSSTIPFGIALALGSIAFLFMKKKPKSTVDLIRVLDIHKGDYDIPTLKSKNRYIPYRSGSYKGKTYIYMEGDSSGDEKYAFMSDTTDVTSSESEYEEMDINDIYVPDSPKYKTLIEVVLEPSKSNGNTPSKGDGNTLGDDMVPTTNTFTDEEWNELKHDFISQYIQSRLPMDVPQYDVSKELPMNIVGNVLDDGINEKPFITSIHDRDLYTGEEISYNIHMSTNSMDDPKYVSNNVYSGIDLINDTLSGNQHIDIYDEVLKRKENELFGTNYKKNTSNNNVAKLTNSDPIMNQLDLLHTWLDRHRNICEKWNTKEELLDKLNEQWNKEKDGGNVPIDNRSLNTNVSFEIDMDDPKGKKEFSNMDTILDNIEDDIYYDVNDDENPSVNDIPMDHNKVDVPKKVHVEMKILNNTSNGSLEPEFPISDVWNI
ncbi:erythrocyte membrane protein 1 [Plasmodium falciparum IGH-CR14]|uniref:Erythrocyte membrane protein 1 n=1 Tax=Plasmodium falciparum IGH-CR14 TaxID=580059 RepID=A0A0L1I611_PLAFA|nr:erythrocyte membrane protein 1 [Plasmodium falciparum IGH-CR14]